MPNLTCQGCGNVVRVQGLAAICPFCGQLVSVETHEAESMDPVSAAETEFSPAPLPRDYSPAQAQKAPVEPSYALYYLIGGLAAVVIVLVAALVIVVSASRKTPPPAPVVIAPPSPTSRTAKGEPKGSEWFSENPTPAPSTPAPRPVVETEPEPPRPVPTSKPDAPPPPHAELAKLQPTSQPVNPRFVTDEQIGNAITRGAGYLLGQFSKTRLKSADSYDPETFQGLNALAVYSLLHTAAATNDPKLGRESEVVKDLLDRLKEFPMTGNRATYSRSLRISAMTVYNRPQDRPTIESDLKWLLESARRGAYEYTMPPADRTHESNSWDNSNSQYGALGVWAAAEAGFRVPTQYWTDVEQHWQNCQLASGGWSYKENGVANLAMSAAGATMLFVARDRMAADNPPSQAYIPLTKAQVHALEWFDEGDNSVNIDGGHRGYSLYGMERVGLACGYKYFGTHDWYQELAARMMREQKPDGSWEGGDSAVAETSFVLLFLSRGRHPVFMAKLRYDGQWNNRPRDIDVLTRFATRQLERPLNWQVADLSRSWWDWLDAPVLYISSDRAPTLTDPDIEKLRSFAQAGGLIFTQAERDSATFNGFAAELASRLFPDMSFDAVPEDHVIYSTVYPVAVKPPLRAVSNGVRLLMVHSPTDLARWWQPFPPKTQRPSSEMAINIAVYAAGLRDLRNRLASPFVPEPDWQPAGIVPVARLQYKGNWDPEPAAWTRMARVLQNQTAIGLKILPTAVADLKYENAPIAHLTGTADLNLSDAETDALRVFVTRGGILLIDACGGSKAFSESVQKKLLPKLFLDATPDTLGPDHPLLAGKGKEMKNLREPRLRPLVTDKSLSPILTVRGGSGMILFSRLDLTSGLLGTNTAGVAGYQPVWAQDFVRNLVLWTLTRIPTS